MSTSASIIRLAARGDGETADGRFAPGALPGDELLADGTVVQHARRAAPVCRHFGDCGGCQLQHVPEDGLSDFARDRILRPLERLGIRPEQVMPVHLSPAFARRRASLRATRRDGTVRIGFNARAEHRIVDLAECPVMHPELMALLVPLRELLAPALGEGAAIAVHLVLTEGGVDLLLGNLQAPALPEIAGLVDFARRHRLARLSVKGEEGLQTIIELSPPVVHMGGVAVRLPPAAFLQPTEDGERALLAAVEAIVPAKARRVADLFAGCGTFALPLSRHCSVLAVEGAGASVAALAEAAAQGQTRLRTEHRDLFRRPLMPEELRRFDGVVIDPPRAGAEAQCHQLAASRVPVIAAISCNPATFARDAAILVRGGYRLQRLWPVAQFRWSTHVELVAEFRRLSRRRGA